MYIHSGSTEQFSWYSCYTLLVRPSIYGPPPAGTAATIILFSRINRPDHPIVPIAKLLYRVLGLMFIIALISIKLAEINFTKLCYFAHFGFRFQLIKNSVELIILISQFISLITV